MNQVRPKDKGEYISFFKALANEERMAMVQLLHENTEMFAQDIERKFYLEQSTTSHHLNILRRAGIMKTRKDGRRIFYSLDYDQFKVKWQEIGQRFFDPNAHIK